jgi:chromosomal replication initiation ATPase DnaA
MKKEIFDQYADSIVRLFGITHEELYSKNRIIKLVDARQLLYYMCHERNIRVTQIQEFMKENGYDTNHSTIIGGVRSMAVKVKLDPDYRVVISKLKDNAEISI